MHALYVQLAPQASQVLTPEDQKERDGPQSGAADDPSVPCHRDARPTLDEVLALRAERTAVVRDVLAALTDDVLAGPTGSIPPPGYPPAGTYPVRRCLQAVVTEEWEHRLFAERDLAVPEARS